MLLTKMNLILFLGSGISLESGLPKVSDLSESILNSAKHPRESMFLRALKNYDDKARLVGGTTYTSSKETVGEIYRDSTSYEDLYYLCEEIALFDWGLHNNAMVSAFMEALIQEFSFLKSNSIQNKLLEIGKYAHSAKSFINNEILVNLNTPEEIKGLDLIVQLTNNTKVTSLEILTLNHDLLVERLFKENGIECADGFGKADGDVRWFEPDNYLSDLKVKLIKLHGSIDWYSFLIDGYEKMAKIECDNISEKRNLSGTRLQLLNKSPKVLSGLNKIKYYNSGIFTDIHYYFQRALYQNSLMIMSGYGWGDDAINNRLMTWLDKKRENKMILLHKNPDILKERSMIFDRDFSNWIKLGKIIHIDKWLCDANLDEVLEHCK